MITQLDLIRGATGAYVIAVPATLPEGVLRMQVAPASVALLGEVGVIARVDKIDPTVTAALGALQQVALIEIVEDKPVPTTIRHWAQIEKVDLL